MLSYGAYVAIMFFSIFVLILVGSIILLKLPVQQFVRLLESLFRYEEVRNDGNNVVIIDVCGDNFELSKTLSSRIPFVLAVGMCFMVVFLVFSEGCIFSTRHIYGKKLCSNRIPNCYLFESRWTSFSPFYQYVCQPDEPVIPANISASYAICYGFVLTDQSTIDILNQMGICSGILSMIDYLYPLVYRFGHQRYGLLCLVLIICGIVITEIVLLSIQVNISFITFILFCLTVCLLATIIYLQYKMRKHPVVLSRIGYGTELN